MGDTSVTPVEAGTLSHKHCGDGRPMRGRAVLRSALQGTLQARGQIMNTPHFLATQRPGWKQWLFYSVELLQFSSSECLQGEGGIRQLGVGGRWQASCILWPPPRPNWSWLPSRPNQSYKEC